MSVNIESMENKVVIIGSGIVGMTIAYQLLTRKLSNNVLIIEKENIPGKHTSGRNSGVVHSGLYYKPESLKAKVCVKGSKRLRKWVSERNLYLNKCGKLILPTNEYLNNRIDELYDRGQKNGCNVEIWELEKLTKNFPYVNLTCGRALWSPDTSIISPKEILSTLFNELKEKNVNFLFNSEITSVNQTMNFIEINSDKKVYFDYLFNCAGLHADKVAKLYDLASNYKLTPFKGQYLKLKENFKYNVRSNIYPVPDLNIPFLGVHFTPGSSGTYIGPTATLALGRENYNGIDSLEPYSLIDNINILTKQYFSGKNGFRRYFHEQAFQTFRPFFIKAAKELIPSVRAENLEYSNKSGIRAQLIDLKNLKLVDDFISLETNNSMHVLNAISPAFTSGFELADLIINKSKIV